MNKEYIIRKNEEISLIVKTGNKKVTKFFIIYYIIIPFISKGRTLGGIYLKVKIEYKNKIIDKGNCSEMNGG